MLTRMPEPPHNSIPPSAGNQKEDPGSPEGSPIPRIPPIMSDPLVRGSDYLNAVRQIAIDPSTIWSGEDIIERIQVCTWIGEHIETINQQLREYLDACHQCFPVSERRAIVIFAAPIAPDYGIDALCNILVDPVAIVIDVGRTAPQDWLSIVVHEYAHAYLSSPGHDTRLLEVLTHLCLGLGLEPPNATGMDERAMDQMLRNWPHCNATADPLAFWRGH